MAVIQYESDVSVRGRVLIDGGLPHQFLKADGSLDSNTYALASSVHNPVTIGTANGLSLSNQQLSLGLASSGTTGALSGTDWNTFNNKQPAITGLTTNYLPKWNGSGFGNSQIVDNGSKVRSDLGFVASSSDPNNVLKSVRFTGNGGLSVTDTGGEISLGTSDASTEYVGARIVLQASETWSPNSARGSNLLFQNCQNGSTVLSERMRISDMGNVGINQPNPTEKLDVVGNIKASGTISASPATTANQVVVMSQINGKANADGSNVSGTWGINISGNARAINIGTSASISNLNISANDHAVRFDTFNAQASNKPISVNNANGVISFLMNHGPQYGKQIAFADNDDLYIRRLSAGTYGNWLSVIHSGNIGSQSVNYANSSHSAQISNSCTGNASSASSVAWSGVSSKPADWLNSSSLIADHSNANEWKNSGFYENGGGGSNWPTNGTWYNSINVRHSNQNNYHGFQVAMSYYDNNLWYRSYQGGGTFQAWQRAVGSNELDNYVGKTSGNRPGVTRLYRRDSDEPYNLQHNWTGTHWLLRGYYNDDFHAEVKVDYANSAGSAPNGTNSNPQYNVTPGEGYGIKFWSNDSFKISMGASSLYVYGPVTDYSIKMQMDSGSPGRGFTWGREGNAPIASLNSTSGNFQTAGFVRSNRYYTDSNYYSLVGIDDNDSFGNPWYGIGKKNGSIVNLNGWSGINFRTNGATVAIDTGGNISTPGKMTLNSTAAGAGYWTAFVTNSRTALSSLTSGNGYGIFYYQGSSGRDGADSIDFAFNTTTSATSALSIKTKGDMKLAGAFTAGGSITAYSDKRLKTNIRDIKNPLSGILKVKGVLYDRLDNDSKDQIGFLAQDLEEIFPELVITGLDGIKSVNYQAMTAILVEAIKEQQLQIDKLKS